MRWLGPLLVLVLSLPARAAGPAPGAMPADQAVLRLPVFAGLRLEDRLVDPEGSGAPILPSLAFDQSYTRLARTFRPLGLRVRASPWLVVSGDFDRDDPAALGLVNFSMRRDAVRLATSLHSDGQTHRASQSVTYDVNPSLRMTAVRQEVRSSRDDMGVEWTQVTYGLRYAPSPGLVLNLTGFDGPASRLEGRVQYRAGDRLVLHAALAGGASLYYGFMEIDYRLRPAIRLRLNAAQRGSEGVESVAGAAQLDLSLPRNHTLNLAYAVAETRCPGCASAESALRVRWSQRRDPWQWGVEYGPGSLALLVGHKTWDTGLRISLPPGEAGFVLSSSSRF